MRRESKSLDVSRWAALTDRLGIGPNRDTFEKLQTAYAERHRHYHSAEHIAHCLTELDATRQLAREPGEVELALWFHDAVYATRSKDNELKSADWAARFLADNAVDAARVRRVHDLIMATAHAAAPDDSDAQLLTDIDLSILGTDPETFRRFEKNVRREYWWVPSPLFRHKRATILQSFLGRPSIYATAHFQERLESAARRNLTEAIAALTGVP
jgi:predicted metal-dependent HD superfamily phosphohydrolase